ncbi:MAG: VOC family protein [Armatimonadetes bacterium]|nr:VOC family protein [Armatimonadota bacterium]
MISFVDHVLILTGDLSTLIPPYETLGFEVVRGGVHPQGTENALIPLADGSYLELIAAPTPEIARKSRYWQRADGGLRGYGEYGGYACNCGDLDGDAAGMRARGLAVEGPMDGSRQRPDGQMVRWKRVYPEHLDLPAAVQDVTPHTLKIAPPTRGVGLHARMAAVVVLVPDAGAAARLYEQFLGRAREERPEAKGRDRHFPLPQGRVIVREPAPGTPAREHLERKGSGLYEVVLAVRGWPGTLGPLEGHLRRDGDARLIDPALTGGVRILVEPDR